MVSAAASLAFPARTYMKTHETEVVEGGDETPQDSKIIFCVHCHKGFKSSKALYGHLRIHIQYRDRSKTEVKTQRKPSPEEDEDCGFGCLVCNGSFSSMQLLCRHMRIHCETVSNGVRKPTMSQESNSLSKAKTTVKQEIESTVYLLKDLPGWSQTGKRGLKKTASDDDIIHDVVYCGPADPHMEIRKRKKIEETMAYQDTSTEGVAGSESPVELSGNCMAIDRFGTHDCNKSRSRSRQGTRSMKKAKVMKSVHECEICGKTFASGQALSGHKTYHRVKDPSKVELVQAKIKKESSGEVPK